MKAFVVMSDRSLNAVQEFEEQLRRFGLPVESCIRAAISSFECYTEHCANEIFCGNVV